MSHSFAPVPTSYIYHRPGLWACRHCGLFTDNQGADVIKAYPDCATFERAITQSTGSNPYGPGGSDYPFAHGAWGKAPAPKVSAGGTWVVGGGGGGSISGGVCGHGTLDPALTASGLPIRNPQPESGFKAKAPAPKHVAGIDHEEIDWSAHKEFMRGM